LSDHFDDGDDGAFRLSRSAFKKLIDQGAVTLNGKAARASTRVQGGESVEVLLPEPVPVEWVAEPIALDILFEDHDVVVVNKEASMVVHPGAGHSRGTLVNALLSHCDDLSGIGGVQRPGIVHRLDRGTSGVIIVAKHDRAHENLAKQFAERLATKIYTAFVIGTPAPASGTIDTPYGRHPKDRKRFTSKFESEKRAVTHYSLVATADGLSQMEVRLETGRTHQIRVHFFDVGHPCVGDQTYGARKLRDLKNDAKDAVKALTRQALHAATLKILHPVSGEPLELTAPLPPDMQALRRAIRP